MGRAVQAIASVAVLLLAAVHLKACALHPWAPPDEPTAYAVIGEDGRQLDLLFTPEREVLARYALPAGSTEVVLIQARGTYGTRLFSNVWKLDGPGIWFGYRVYPDGVRPAVMELTVLDKVGDAERTGFLGTGERTHATMLFSEEAVYFEGMWLRRLPTVDPALTAMLDRLRSTP